jgi:hypothetical protein
MAAWVGVEERLASSSSNPAFGVAAGNTRLVTTCEGRLADCGVKVTVVCSLLLFWLGGKSSNPAVPRSPETSSHPPAPSSPTMRRSFRDALQHTVTQSTPGRGGDGLHHCPTSPICICERVSRMRSGR